MDQREVRRAARECKGNGVDCCWRVRSGLRERVNGVRTREGAMRLHEAESVHTGHIRRAVTAAAVIKEE